MQLTPGTLLHTVAKHWWLLAIRGALAILFGILAFANPVSMGMTVMWVFGFYVLLDGVLALVAGFRSKMGWMILHGAVGVLLGGLILAMPGLAAIVVTSFIGAWAVVHGALQVYNAWKVRKEIPNEVLLILGGLASIAFGVMVWLRPVAGALSIVTIMGIYAIVFGVTLIGASLRLRKLSKHLEATGHAAPKV